LLSVCEESTQDAMYWTVRRPIVTIMGPLDDERPLADEAVRRREPFADEEAGGHEAVRRREAVAAT
jgi:hypothetical protein